MRTLRRYDHRLRDIVHSTGDASIAIRIGVPRSTAAGWIKRETKQVVSLHANTIDLEMVERENAMLRAQIQKLRCILRVVFTLIRVMNARLGHARIPNGAEKSALLRVLERASHHIPLKALLPSIGLTVARYYEWKSLEACQLADLSSCPRTSPSQITPDEIESMRQMVHSPEYRHINTGGVARLAQRIGKIFASSTTWYRFVKRFGWKRPRHRVYPPKPKIGIRAAKPNEIWHIDTTMIRLLDGTKVYLHAVLDNYSRRVLAWCIDAAFDASATAKLLSIAAKELKGSAPKVFMDSGIENKNASVDALIDSGAIKRVLAQVEVVFSNSMIESWWRHLKHQWLYLNTLDTLETVRKLIAFYVEQHNTVIPHSAFKGQTPNEMYFGTGTDVADKLSASRIAARQSRRESNIARRCNACAPTEPNLVAIEKQPDT
jgi:putative transposase